jgi:dihydrofolate synthase/folylpolyglutamate synthase
VITNIGFDHVAILGDTLEKIAFEKAGIIKPNVPVIIGEIRKETKAVFLEKAMQTEAPISFAENYTSSDYKSDLKGSYQKRNIITVLAAIKTLIDLGLKISDDQIKEGLLNVVVNTGLLGRWQVLGHNPKIICDTAHNREGLEYIVSQLMDEKYDHLHIVYGSVNDKNLDTVLDILPKSATYYFCKPKVQRGMDEVELASKFLEKGFSGNFYSSVEQAYNEAKSRAKETDLIFIGGSTFVVAEVL